MDNQGSTNFNPQQDSPARDANFWNPTQNSQIPQSPAQPQNFQTMSNPSYNPNSQPNLFNQPRLRSLTIFLIKLPQPVRTY